MNETETHEKLKVFEKYAEEFQKADEEFQKADEELKLKDSVAYAKKLKKYFEAEVLLKKSEERKKLYKSIHMSDEKARRIFTI